MKKKFNAKQWLDKSATENNTVTSPASGEAAVPHPATSDSSISDIDNVLLKIESSHLDLTANYADWRNIGFAFADELGESGRDLFHRVSRFHPGYKPEECNKQFDACLKASGHGITIKSFFFLAKQAGINVSCRPAASNSFIHSIPSNDKSWNNNSDEQNILKDLVDEPDEPAPTLP